MQLPKSYRANKRDIMAYVFLDDKCLDSLILGASGNPSKESKLLD